jgi:hypothetical protein
MVFGQPEQVSRLRRSKSKGVVTWGFFLDIFDGIRARRTGTTSPEGALLDLSADRTQEAFLGLSILLHNWQHTNQQSEAKRQEFLDLLMIPTATILPTLAAAQGRMLDITIPEKSPTGGSRFDRFMKLNRAYRASLNGNYEKSNRSLKQMLTNVQGAYEFRSERTAEYRTKADDPTSFDLTRVTLDPLSPNDKTRRGQLETWLHFTWFLRKTVSFVTDQMLQTGVDHALIAQYQAAVQKQLGDYYHVDASGLVESLRRGAPADEFTSTLSDSLSPQGMLGLAEQPQSQTEPVIVYRR